MHAVDNIKSKTGKVIAISRHRVTIRWHFGNQVTYKKSELFGKIKLYELGKKGSKRNEV